MAGANGRLRARAAPRGRRFFFLGVAGLAVLSVTFVLGVRVGRHWVPGDRPPGEAEQGKRPATAPRRGLSEAQSLRPPQIQEKLTFYETLTAPLAATPPPARPEAKPRDDGVKDQAKIQPEPAGGAYTVQVAAYRARSPAEEMERKLKGAGFEAYVVGSSGADGRMTYRVRVGSFATRDQAEQTAERLRSDHGLSPFVASR